MSEPVLPVPVVEVTAVGRASCVPDQVSVGLGVDVTTQTVGQSLREAATAVQQLLEVLDAAGVAGRDRQTSGLSVSPAWDPRTDRQSGHTASYQLRLVVRDLDSAGRLVERASEAVGDRLRVHGFELSVADPLPQQEQARRAAVTACRRQAEQLADAAGAALGDLLGLEEGGRGEQVDRLVWAQGRKSRSAGMPVEAGELEVAVVVTGRWQLRAVAPLLDVDPLTGMPSVRVGGVVTAEDVALAQEDE